MRNKSNYRKIKLHLWCKKSQIKPNITHWTFSIVRNVESEADLIAEKMF